MEAKEFAKKVQEMRKAQINFFEARKKGLQSVASDWLNKSKTLEREVDAAAAAILAPSTQQTLL